MINVENIEIGFFSDKKVIPLSYNMGGFQITNIKLPDIIVHNNRDDNISLSLLDVIGFNSDKEIVKYTLHKDELKEILELITPQINNSIESNNLFDPLKLTFGKTQKFDTGFSSDTSIESQGIILIPLSLILFCHYIGLKTIDSLLINFTFEFDQKSKQIEFPIDLFLFNTGDNYIFPMKGSLCICNLPMNFPQHRKAHSQEFAIDIVGYDFLSSNQAVSTRNTDYSIYGKDVLSIGDGVIVEIGNNFPESKMNNPNSYSEKYFNKLSENLVPLIGIKNTMLGNYIIIKHKSDEFSVYAHLQENSICVDIDDKVMQGDVIAKVGNTGHSTEPHLHFQLIDSLNVFEANGLPIVFKNLPIRKMNQHFSKSNSLINSDYFYVSID